MQRVFYAYTISRLLYHLFMKIMIMARCQTVNIKSYINYNKLFFKYNTIQYKYLYYIRIKQCLHRII